MANVPDNPKLINARRFAALLAGFDTGNACDEEALNKGRALRRMAVESNSRIVDLLEIPEVRDAIDAQMRPARRDNRELETALEELAAMRNELTERTRNVRSLAELLKREKESSMALRNALATRARNEPQPLRPAGQSVPVPSATHSARRVVPISMGDLVMLLGIFFTLAALVSMIGSMVW